MRYLQAASVVLPLLLTGCAVVTTVPPADVPGVAPRTVVSDDRSGWRPYSSGPMQTSSSRRADGKWTTPRAARDETVTRSEIPEIVTETRPSETVDGKPVSSASSPGPAVAATGGSDPSAQPAASTSTFKPSHSLPATPSVFGSGVSSAWAAGYVPEAYRSEFAIFARKAAVDGQARMTLSTGEVYSASVSRRNGACSTLEVGVTADGNLPVVSRGLVQVCK